MNDNNLNKMEADPIVKSEPMSAEECEEAISELERELESYAESVGAESAPETDDEPILETSSVFEEPVVTERADVDRDGFRSLDGEKEQNGKDESFAFTLTELPEENARDKGAESRDSGSSVAYVVDDELFTMAARVIVQEGVISASFLQRRFSIGFGRACEIIERLEKLGVVSPVDGNRARRVLVSPERLERILSEC